MARHRIHHLVNPWQGEVAFKADLVKISEVNEDSSLAILFLHQDRVSEPFGIVRLSDKVGSE